MSSLLLHSKEISKTSNKRFGNYLTFYPLFVSQQYIPLYLLFHMVSLHSIDIRSPLVFLPFLPQNSISLPFLLLPPSISFHPFEIVQGGYQPAFPSFYLPPLYSLYSTTIDSLTRAGKRVQREGEGVTTKEPHQLTAPLSTFPHNTVISLEQSFLPLSLSLSLTGNRLKGREVKLKMNE